ncbi:MAG: hypothetical protein ACKOGL_13725, partial [Acidimicrobiaceae bacterium]
QKVRAIFGSEVFPSTVLEQIGAETGVRYVDVLRDDDLLGEQGDQEHSWLGLMRFNFVTIVEALGGDASALKSLDVRDVVKDEARMQQLLLACIVTLRLSVFTCDRSGDACGS